MRLLIIGINFAPEITGVGKYTGEMAAWLARRGHEVTVITTRPYYPEWKKAHGLGRWTWRSETWEGCRVIRCPLYVPHRVAGMTRLAHLVSFALSSLPAAAAQLVGGKVDVVAAIAPALLSAPVALATARMMRAKAWLHFQDFEIDVAAGLGIIHASRLMATAQWAERQLIRRFDLVSAISPKMVDALARKGVARERLLLFPNGVDTHRIFPLPEPVALRCELGIPKESCVALYAGSMAKKQGLEFIVAAARGLNEAGGRAIVFLLAGAGPARAGLERDAQGLANVRFLPLQPDERFNELLNAGDIFLLPQRTGAADLVMPSKLGPMLAAGRPVIATVPSDSQLAHAIEGAGLVVAPENADALAAAIRELADDPPRRSALGAAARRAAMAMNQEANFARLATRLAEV